MLAAEWKQREFQLKVRVIGQQVSFFALCIITIAIIHSFYITLQNNLFISENWEEIIPHYFFLVLGSTFTSRPICLLLLHLLRPISQMLLLIHTLLLRNGTAPTFLQYILRNKLLVLMQKSNFNDKLN